MRIACPECQSEFDVPFALLGPEGRRVRCASCRHVWTAGIPETPLPSAVESPYSPPESSVSESAQEIDFSFIPPSPSSPTPTTSAIKSAKPQKITSREHKIVVQAAMIAVILASVLVVGRQILVDALPPLAQVYKGLGISVMARGEGMGIDRLITQPIREGDSLAIKVSTRLLNLTDHSIQSAPILFEWLDKTGKPTGKSWVIQPPVPSIAPQQTIPFEAILTDIPPIGTGDTPQIRASVAVTK